MNKLTPQNPLVIANLPSREALLSIKKQFPNKKPLTIWWVDGNTDQEGLQRLLQSHDNIFVEKSLCNQIQALFNIDARIIELEPVVRKNNRRPTLFFPENDTHVVMFQNVWRHIPEYEIGILETKDIEAAGATLSAIGKPYRVWTKGLIRELLPGLVVFGDDWGFKAMEVIDECRELGIATICIQEGCLDWGPPENRMEFSDYPMIQGIEMLKYLKHDSFFLTGNPRFDGIHPVSLPNSPRVMINVNFTYGFYEEHRSKWVKSCVEACKMNGLDFFISQHPRDSGKFPSLPVLPSNPKIVHDHLAQSSILITRFSTLVYEAMLMGRKVIYFNPHKETMELFRHDTTGGLEITNSFEELSSILEKSTGSKKLNEKELKFLVAYSLLALSGTTSPHLRHTHLRTRRIHRGLSNLVLKVKGFLRDRQ
jgi:hypothetical protein